MPAQLILVMGVSGTGKSTIAKALAEQFDFTYLDADDFHNEQAKKMMADGQPINDDIRQAWITRILLFLADEHHSKTRFVLAYSGLKKSQRQRFQHLESQLNGIFLYGDYSVIAQRLSNRSGHFFSTTLLDSQFEALELPVENSDENIALIDINQPVDNIINQAKRVIALQQVTPQRNSA
ncbi:gluconokinase, GntK/IdnK-type [Thalassotalea sp. SU-HH00458]|uniref:gluconokinase n=1 Tax=Thalassotalea sp. SU-HH00458 TaxID=3127657 RepID=UPI00310BC520